MDAIDRAVRALRERTSVLVFTGAGVSTESGIPDFRGPSGVWTRVDPVEFTYDRYVESADTRRASWRHRASSHVLDAEPNAAHHAIVTMWKENRIVGCVTQNIDGLHQKAGLPDDVVVELHGNAVTTTCLGCGDRVATADVLARVDAGDDDPHCKACGGILKAAVVFFGEPMPVGEMARSHDMAMAADAVLVVGSTLSVFPAVYVPLAVVEAGHPMVIVNQGPTELDRLADVTIDMPSGEALPAIAAALSR